MTSLNVFLFFSGNVDLKRQMADSQTVSNNSGIGASPFAVSVLLSEGLYTHTSPLHGVSLILHDSVSAPQKHSV